MSIDELRAQISRYAGSEAAERAIKLALDAAGLPLEERYPPQELLAFADGLVGQGGFVELVGRIVRFRALSSGARLA